MSGVIIRQYATSERAQSVNDRFGHDSGDQALRVVSDAIKASVEASDLVARIKAHVLYISSRKRECLFWSLARFTFKQQEEA